MRIVYTTKPHISKYKSWWCVRPPKDFGIDDVFLKAPGLFAFPTWEDARIAAMSFYKKMTR